MDTWTCTEVDVGRFSTSDKSVLWYSTIEGYGYPTMTTRKEFNIRGVVKRFTIPSFKGTPVNIAIQDANNIGSSGTVYCILCSSLDKIAEYFSPVNNPREVKDESRLDIKEIPVIYGKNTYTVSALSASLEKDQEYFLILFPKTITDGIWINKAPILLYTSKGSARISSETGTNMYQVYIDDGSIQSLYAPYIDTGTSWEICT